MFPCKTVSKLFIRRVTICSSSNHTLFVELFERATKMRSIDKSYCLCLELVILKIA